MIKKKLIRWDGYVIGVLQLALSHTVSDGLVVLIGYKLRYICISENFFILCDSYHLIVFLSCTVSSMRESTNLPVCCFAVAKDLALEADNSEAVCKAGWLAGCLITPVHLSREHGQLVALAHKQCFCVRTPACSAARFRFQESVVETAAISQ